MRCLFSRSPWLRGLRCLRASQVQRPPPPGAPVRRLVVCQLSPGPQSWRISGNVGRSSAGFPWPGASQRARGVIYDARFVGNGQAQAHQPGPPHDLARVVSHPAPCPAANGVRPRHLGAVPPGPQAAPAVGAPILPPVHTANGGLEHLTRRPAPARRSEYKTHCASFIHKPTNINYLAISVLGYDYGFRTSTPPLAGLHPSDFWLQVAAGASALLPEWPAIAPGCPRTCWNVRREHSTVQDRPDA